MKLPSPVSPGQPLSAKAFNELLAYVRSLELRSGPGVIVQRSAAGTTVASRTEPAKRGGGPAILTHPFQAADATAEGVAKVRIRTGSINDLVPSSVETDLTLSAAGTWRIYLDCTLNTDSTGAVTAAAISTTSGAQPANTRTHAYITLAIATVTGSSGAYVVADLSQLATHSLRFFSCNRDDSVDGTYHFWGV